MKTAPQLASEFLTYIQTRNNLSRQLVSSDWLRFAVKSSGGPGNPKGTTIAISQRATEEIILALEKTMMGIFESPSLSFSSYDRSFTDLLCLMKRLVRKHSPETKFSFGRAQKIANIYLKYAYTSALSSKSRTPSTDHLINLRKMLHIPVDRQTLRSLYNYPNYRHLTKEANGKFTSWKWDLKEPVYLRIQNCFRDLAKVNGYEEAMHFEMDRIWTQPTSDRSRL